MTWTPEMHDWIACEISHDVRCATTEDEGLNRVRWNNRAMTAAVAHIRELERELTALRAAVKDEQSISEREKTLLLRFPLGTANAEDAYSDWCKERETIRNTLAALLAPPPEVS